MFIRKIKKGGWVMGINKKLEERINELDINEQRIALLLLKGIEEGKANSQLEELIIDEIDYLLEEGE